MLDAGRLAESIGELVKVNNDELYEKYLWDMWLHKHFEGNPSWEDFRNRHLNPIQHNSPAKQEVKMDDFEAIVKNSRDLMNSFCSSPK